MYFLNGRFILVSLLSDMFLLEFTRRTRWDRRREKKIIYSSNIFLLYLNKFNYILHWFAGDSVTFMLAQWFE